jgi:hypothetical protein
MRLIDADAKALNPETINGIDFDTAIKEVETFLNSDECKYPLHIYLCAVRDFAEWYRDELKEAPTISAVPVVRGEWVKSDDYKGWLVCSACHDCYVDNAWVNGKKWRYCPNCGSYNGGDNA